MPFRSMSTLESWIDEFRSLGYPIAGSLRVMRQDGDHGANTGLVGVTLAGIANVVYVQPESVDSHRWLITIEPAPDAVTIDSAAAVNLATEITMLSALCAFLQAKSAAFEGSDRP